MTFAPEIRSRLQDAAGYIFDMDGTIALGETDLRVAFSCIEDEYLEDLFAIIYKGVQELSN